MDEFVNWKRVVCQSINSKILGSTYHHVKTFNSLGKLASINALPSPHLGLLLNSETIRIPVGITFGLSICEQHNCICGSIVDLTGRHGSSCLTIVGRYSRQYCPKSYNKKRDLNTTDFPSILEPRGLIRTHGRRPDGLKLGTLPWMKFLLTF